MCARLPVRKEHAVFRKPFCCDPGCALLGILLAVSLPAQGQGSLPQAPDYRGEIRRGPDGKLMVIPAPEPPAQAPSPVWVSKATMVVGPGERVGTLSEAARLARDGEVIEVRPGSYRGQPALWTQDNLVIRGAGQRPVIIGDGKSGEDKAIWVVRGGNVRIENIEFRGARAADGKGAGIRFEKGRLSVNACRFADNDLGIVTGSLAGMALEIADSEFVDAPRDGRATHHLLDVGMIGNLVVRGSRFQNGYLGDLVRSRARENFVLYNMLADGAGGKAAYELEFPIGGIAYVIGNVIGQSEATENPGIVGYGGEGPGWPENALYLSHNTLLNDRHAGSFLNVASAKFPAGVEVWAINNLTVGNGDFDRPAQGRFEGNRSVGRSELIEYGGFPLRLTGMSPLRGSVRPPGSAGTVDLLPNSEFTHPAGTRKIRMSSYLSPGAFQ
jgi:hypothetical protein